MWRGIALTRNQAPASATTESSAAVTHALFRVSRLSFPICLSRRMGCSFRQFRLALPRSASPHREVPPPRSSSIRGSIGGRCTGVLRGTEGRFRLSVHSILQGCRDRRTFNGKRRVQSRADPCRRRAASRPARHLARKSENRPPATRLVARRRSARRACRKLPRRQPRAPCRRRGFARVLGAQRAVPLA